VQPPHLPALCPLSDTSLTHMNKLLSFLLGIPRLLKRAFDAAINSGVTEDLTALAVKLATEAATKFASNDEKRDYVVAELVKRGIKESIARFLVECAVQIIKSRVA
jgi:hypothetical protein